MKKVMIVCGISLFIVGGCGDQFLKLTKVSGEKNTFELEGAYSRVSSVSVFEVPDPNSHSSDQVWCIKSKSGVSGWRFRITVPEVPDSFIQVLPKPPQHFQLRKGQLYEIHVSYGSSPTPAQNRWIAENKLNK